MQFCVFVGLFVLPSFSYTFVVYLSLCCAGIYLAMAIPHTVRQYKMRKRAAKAGHEM